VGAREHVLSTAPDDGSFQPMKTYITSLIVLVAAVGMLGSGCGKKDGAAKAGDKAEAKAPAVKVYEGDVDYERLNKAMKKAATAWGKSGPGMYAPWTNAYNVMLEQAGKETAKEGNKYYWAYAKGDDCWYVQAENKDDKFQNAKAMKVAKNLKAQYDECMKHIKK